MKTWLPFPLLSLMLLAMWLLLNESVEPAHVMLGFALAIAGGRLLAALQPPTGRVRRRVAAIGVLAGLVIADILRSNLAVGLIVLRPRTSGRVSGFLQMPLEVRHPGALAVLACIITATPGASWARYDAARQELTVHVFDLVDEEDWIDQFKHRYERRLLEIFE